MDAAKYRTILEENLLESAKALRLGLRFTFQQDNDPKHTARATMEWFRSKHIHVLEWPSRSPDQNPIENIWQDLKIAVHRHSPSSQSKLELFCKEEWANISVVETYVSRDLPRKTRSCLCTKRWLYKVLTQGGEYYCMPHVSLYF